MKQANEPLPCVEVVDELAALLYGELDADARARVERHLEACGACRAELEGFAWTKDALDAWSPPASGASEAREALDVALRRARASRGKRSVLFGLAAAALAFLGLSAFGARLDYHHGRVTFSFELPWLPRSELARADGGSDAWTEEVRRIARTAADETLAAWDASQGGRLADWSLREEGERSRLVHAIERAREIDRESFASLLSTFQRGATQEIQFTRAALGELATVVARERAFDDTFESAPESER